MHFNRSWKRLRCKNWRETVKSVVKLTTSWQMRFKECKKFILKRSKRDGNDLVRGETVGIQKRYGNANERMSTTKNYVYDRSKAKHYLWQQK